MEARAGRKSQCFSVVPRAGSPLYQTSLLLAERSKTASTAFNSKDQPSSTPAAYFPIKPLVVLLDIFPSALGIPLKRNLCKAWDWCVCKPKHGLRAYTHKGDSGTPHPQKELPG